MSLGVGDCVGALHSLPFIPQLKEVLKMGARESGSLSQEPRPWGAERSPREARLQNIPEAWTGPGKYQTMRPSPITPGRPQPQWVDPTALACLRQGPSPCSSCGEEQGSSSSLPA